MSLLLFPFLLVSGPAGAAELPSGQAELSAWLLDGGAELAAEVAAPLADAFLPGMWLIGVEGAPVWKRREVVVQAGVVLARGRCRPLASYLGQAAAGLDATPPRTPCGAAGAGEPLRELPLGRAARHDAAVRVLRTLPDPIPYDAVRHGTLDGQTLLYTQVAWTGLHAQLGPEHATRLEAVFRAALDHAGTLPDDGLRDHLDRAVRAAAVAPPHVGAALLFSALAQGLRFADEDPVCVATLTRAVREDPAWEEVAACRWEPIVRVSGPPGRLASMEPVIRAWAPAGWLWPSDPGGADADRWLLARGVLGVYTRVYAGAEEKLVARIGPVLGGWASR